MVLTNTELIIVINTPTGTWDEAEKIIKKICEAQNVITCTLRIEVNLTAV